VQAGARRRAACKLLGLSARTLERWRAQQVGEDRRHGPKTAPRNKLSELERKRVLDVLDSPEFRDLSPRQVVPLLADKGIYIASESTMYRVLAEARQDAHREPSKPRTHHKPTEHVALGPLQVLSWDITYLRGAIRGQFYYLYMYMVMDIWSRKIVAWRVERTESMDYSAELITTWCTAQGVDPEGLVLHSDNGGPMKGYTMLSTLQRLGIVASFSRPRVSDDNPYSEALFRTLKYRPWYPQRPFESLEEARAWVEAFVSWYNEEHLHSGFGYVTPNDRDAGRDEEILARRRKVYEEARRRHPERWSGATRDWTRVDVVLLNPDTHTNHAEEDYDAAA